MNRWGLMSALALAAALLLAGCGGDCGLDDDDSADELQITYEDICERKTMKGNVITAGAVHDNAGRRRWGNTAIAATAGIRL